MNDLISHNNKNNNNNMNANNNNMNDKNNNNNKCDAFLDSCKVQNVFNIKCSNYIMGCKLLYLSQNRKEIHYKFIILGSQVWHTKKERVKFLKN